jgi:hypothetical protein
MHTTMGPKTLLFGKRGKRWVKKDLFKEIPNSKIGPWKNLIL